MTLGWQKGSRSRRDFQFPSNFPILGSWQGMSKLLLLFLGWYVELPATLLGEEGTKRAIDCQENRIPAHHPGMSPKGIWHGKIAGVHLIVGSCGREHQQSWSNSHFLQASLLTCGKLAESVGNEDHKTEAAHGSVEAAALLLH